MSGEASQWRRQRVTLCRTNTEYATVETIIPVGINQVGALKIAEAIADSARAWGVAEVSLQSTDVNTITDLTVPG